MQPLLGPGQHAYANARLAEPGMAVPDAEALRVIPNTDRVLWASEGDFSRGFGPELNEMRREGTWLRDWPLPDMLRLPPRHDKAVRETPPQGPRGGLTLEGMALSPDARTLWLSMEGPLLQDGEMSSPGQTGAPVRITAFDVPTRKAVRQIAYLPDAVSASVQWLRPRPINGVSDILADGPDHLLVLERSFSVDEGWGARLYRIAVHHPGTDNAATDVLRMRRLIDGQYRTVPKQLVLDFAKLGLRSVDNLEGMTWGSPLASGERVLLLVSDNNFNPAEVTQFIALAEQPRCHVE
ncbi:hypothetical protein SDC9_116273 [bioreactor metagenome]|uniref:Phytase-like domain-containing protein n=1 Tax=bioreactor metagenome TaxID=1076179 RepID=A0A645BW47_9ZZZZ